MICLYIYISFQFKNYTKAEELIVTKEEKKNLKAITNNFKCPVDVKEQELTGLCRGKDGEFPLLQPKYIGKFNLSNKSHKGFLEKWNVSFIPEIDLVEKTKQELKKRFSDESYKHLRDQVAGVIAGELAVKKLFEKSKEAENGIICFNYINDLKLKDKTAKGKKIKLSK